MEHDEAEAPTFWRRLEKAGAGLYVIAGALIYLVSDLSPLQFSINPTLRVLLQILFVVCIVLGSASFVAMLGDLYDKRSIRFTLAHKYFGIRLMMTCFLLLILVIGLLFMPAAIFPWMRGQIVFDVFKVLLFLSSWGIPLGAVVAVLEFIFKHAISRGVRKS